MVISRGETDSSFQENGALEASLLTFEGNIHNNALN